MLPMDFRYALIKSIAEQGPSFHACSIDLNKEERSHAVIILYHANLTSVVR